MDWMTWYYYAPMNCCEHVDTGICEMFFIGKIYEEKKKIQHNDRAYFALSRLCFGVNLNDIHCVFIR